MAVAVQQLAGHLFHLIDRLHHMHRDADGARLIRNGACDSLADPPCGVCGKFEALGMVKLFHGLDKAQVALLDKVQKLHAAAHIAFGNGDHKTQVRLGQALLRLFALRAACLYLQRQIDLLFRREQRHASNLLQVHLDRIVDVDSLGGQRTLQHVHSVLRQREFLHVGVRFVHDLDVVRIQCLIELIHKLHFKADFLQRVVDFLRRHLLVALAQLHKVHDDVLFFSHVVYSLLYSCDSAARPRIACAALCFFIL